MSKRIIFNIHQNGWDNQNTVTDHRYMIFEMFSRQQLHLHANVRVCTNQGHCNDKQPKDTLSLGRHHQVMTSTFSRSPMQLSVHPPKQLPLAPNWPFLIAISASLAPPHIGVSSWNIIVEYDLSGLAFSVEMPHCEICPRMSQGKEALVG